MFGVVLAGGRGSRLFPLTAAVNKQLLPVYDKPMVFYPLTTLILTGVKDIYLVTNPEHREQFENLLGDGTSLGIRLEYLIQDSPRGLSDALKLVPDNRRAENFWVALGDNFFYGRGLGRELSKSSDRTGCSVFTYQVSDPSQYGVAEVGKNGSAVRIIEKPDQNFSSKQAVTGLYRFDSKAHEYIDSLTPSERGELEITSLLNCYARTGDIELNQLPRGTVWLDMGSFDMLHEASGLVKTLQNRTGLPIGDPSEASSVLTPE